MTTTPNTPVLKLEEGIHRKAADLEFSDAAAALACLAECALRMPEEAAVIFIRQMHIVRRELNRLGEMMQPHLIDNEGEAA